MRTRRGSGILLHVTSLPTPYGIGDFGPSAYRFIDWLEKAEQSFWQILPLNPTHIQYDNSPYHGLSTFAFNPLLISPDLLYKRDLIKKSELNSIHMKPSHQVQFKKVIQNKMAVLYKAYERFVSSGRDGEFDRFCETNRDWLDDYALYVSLKNKFKGKIWTTWPPEFRDRHPEVMKQAREELHELIERERFIQYLSASQWEHLKTYCDDRGIQIIGDIPIYVEHDSADVWMNPDLFKLDKNKNASVVAGVPPDYFSKTGQLWGNPVYNWETMKANGYDWWIRRIRRHLALFDIVRIDHFRGLVGYWEIPAGQKTAIHGRWVEAPAEDFFHTLRKHLPALPIIAEDLGTITPDVREIMYRNELPGMKVLEFAFGNVNRNNPHILHHIEHRNVIYTGTHDNATIRTWFETELSDQSRSEVFNYLGRRIPASAIHWAFIRLAMMSVADMAIFPVQDVLGLGEGHRMNRPGTSENNWKWCLKPGQLKNSLALKMAELTSIYERN